MASFNSIGFFVALCITFVAAIEQYEYLPIRPYHDHVHKPYHHSHNAANLHGSLADWEHNKFHQHAWHKPNFPMKHVHPRSSRSPEVEEKRRPLFYPMMPHYFYPYAHPSHNDEEFETIEARNYHGFHKPNFPVNQDSQGTMEESGNHESHSPNFPLNSGSSEESDAYVPRPVHHGHYKPHISYHDHHSHGNNKVEYNHFFQQSFHIPHFPLFNPFHKQPSVYEHHNVKENFPTLHGVHLHGNHKPESNKPEHDEEHKNPLNILSNEETTLEIPSNQGHDHHSHENHHHDHHSHEKPQVSEESSVETPHLINESGEEGHDHHNHNHHHDHDHHGHGKPHTDEESSIETPHLDTEESGDGEIVPLSEVVAEVPLQNGDDEAVDEANETDAAPTFSLRSILEKI